MKLNQKSVPLPRAILCVILCVVFTALTTYQFIYYAVYADYREKRGAETAAMQAEYDLLLSARDATVASLEADLAATEEARATLATRAEELCARLVKLTGSETGTAEDCLRLLLVASLTRQGNASGGLSSKYVKEEVDAYLAAHADTYLRTLERLLFIDFLYRANYAGDEIDAAAAEERMIEGYMAAARDVYAVYYTPEEYRDFADKMNAVIRCGIGVISRQADGQEAILVLHVHSASPAKEAGLLPGDLIVGIDGTRVADIGYTAATELVAGEENSEIRLTVSRGGQEMTLSALRRTVEADALIWRIYTNGESGKKIGYIRLLSFSAALPAQLRATLATLESEEIDGLVFDVRDNTGGYLSSIVEVLDIILPQGKLLISFDYENEHYKKEPYYSETEEAIDLPIAVLINRNTASAAELFAAALSDHDYATLVGEKTYGKGTMQTGYRLEDGSYMTVTVAHYLPPNGKSYDGIGVLPHKDVPVSAGYEETVIYLLPQEADAPLTAALNHLITE